MGVLRQKLHQTPRPSTSPRTTESFPSTPEPTSPCATEPSTPALSPLPLTTTLFEPSSLSIPIQGVGQEPREQGSSLGGRLTFSCSHDVGQELCSRGSSLGERLTFPWLTIAERLREERLCLVPWRRFYNEDDAGSTTGDLRVPLYDTSSIDKSIGSPEYLIDCFLQWRMMKSIDATSNKPGRKALCTQWDAFCAHTTQAIHNIPSLKARFYKTKHGRLYQLHQQSLKEGTACACIGYCPSCTKSNRRFDHTFRDHVEYSRLSTRLRDLICSFDEPDQASSSEDQNHPIVLAIRDDLQNVASKYPSEDMLWHIEEQFKSLREDFTVSELQTNIMDDLTDSVADLEQKVDDNESKFSDLIAEHDDAISSIQEDVASSREHTVEHMQYISQTICEVRRQNERIEQQNSRIEQQNKFIISLLIKRKYTDERP